MSIKSSQKFSEISVGKLRRAYKTEDLLINGDGGYGLLAAYRGGPVAPADWLGPKVGGHLAPFLYSSHEPSELSQWLCHADSTISIIVVIIIIIIIIIHDLHCDALMMSPANLRTLSK